MDDTMHIEGFISRTQLRISKAQLKISLKRLAAAKKKGNDRRISRWEKKVEKWIGKVTKWAEKDGKDPEDELSSVDGYSEYKSVDASIQSKVRYPSLNEFDGRSDMEHIEEMIKWIQEEDVEDGTNSMHDIANLVKCQSEILISSSMDQSSIGMEMTDERREWGASRRTQVQKSAEQEAVSLLQKSGNDHDTALQSASKDLIAAVKADSYKDAEFMAYVVQYLRVLKSEKDIPGGWVRGDMNEIEGFINEVALEEGADAAIAAAYELRSQIDKNHEHYAQLGNVINKADTDDALIGIIIGRGIIGNKRLLKRIKKIVNDEQYAAVEAITEEAELVKYLRSIVGGLNARDERQLQRVIGDITKRMGRDSSRASAAIRRTTRAERFRQWRERRRATARSKQVDRFAKTVSPEPDSSGYITPYGGASELSDVTIRDPIVPAEIVSLLESVHDSKTVAEAIKPVAEHYQCCENCGQPSKRKCKGCSTVYYCNSECSNADWKYHKPECQAIQKETKWNDLEGTEAMDVENPQSILMRQLTRHPIQEEFELVDVSDEEIGDQLPELEDYDPSSYKGVPELEYIGSDVESSEDPELEYIGPRAGRGGRKGGRRGGRVGRRRPMRGYGINYLRRGPRRFRRGRFGGFGRRGYYGRGYGPRYRPWGLISTLALDTLGLGLSAVNPYYYWYYPQYRAAVLARYPGYVLPGDFVPPAWIPYSGWSAPPGYGGGYGRGYGYGIY